MLQNEQKRVQDYLHPTTHVKLIEICEKVLINEPLYVFYAEFQNILETCKNEDLGRMYRLVSRISNGLDELKNLFETHAANQILAALVECKDSAGEVSISI